MLAEKPVVLGVGANPVPDQHVAVSNTENTISDANPGRIDVVVSGSSLEVQAIVIGIFPELPVRALRLTPGLDRQRR